LGKRKGRGKIGLKERKMEKKKGRGKRRKKKVKIRNSGRERNTVGCMEKGGKRKEREERS
jgi:hypothetical protein